MPADDRRGTRKRKRVGRGPFARARHAFSPSRDRREFTTVAVRYSAGILAPFDQGLRRLRPMKGEAGRGTTCAHAGPRPFKRQRFPKLPTEPFR